MERGGYELFTLRGSHFEMGRQHGQQCRSLIHQHLQHLIARRAGEVALDRGAMLAEALRYRPYVERHLPAVAEELSGLATGADIELAEAYALQLRAELLRAPAPDEAADGCTTFAAVGSATAGGAPLLGGNMDLAASYREVTVVLQLQPTEGLPLLMLTPAGQVGYAGLNAAGLAVMGNFVASAGWRIGLPRYLLTRLVLQHETLADAVAAVRAVHRASPRGLMLIDAGGEAGCLELTVGEDALVTPQRDLLAHSNHYVHPSLQHAERMPPAALHNSRRRRARMQELVSMHHGRLDATLAQSILRDRQGAPASICRHAGEGSTDVMSFASMIAEPQQRRLWIAAGPPDQHDYQRYEL